MRKNLKHLFVYYACSLLTADGDSTIVCTAEDFIVNKGDINIAGPLAVDRDVSCSYTYILTADDVDNLERKAVVKVTGKDEYDYEVDASDTEVVSLSQVTTQFKRKGFDAIISLFRGSEKKRIILINRYSSCRECTYRPRYLNETLPPPMPKSQAPLPTHPFLCFSASSSSRVFDPKSNLRKRCRPSVCYTISTIYNGCFAV